MVAGSRESVYPERSRGANLQRREACSLQRAGKETQMAKGNNAQQKNVKKPKKSKADKGKK